MSLAATFIIGFCFLLACFLALAVFWGLMKAPQGDNRGRAIVAGLIGIALGIVLCQAAWVLLAKPAPAPETNVMQRLNVLEKQQATAQAEISQTKDDIGNLASGQKPISGTLSKLDKRVTALEGKVLPPEPHLTLYGLQVVRNGPKLHLRPLTSGAIMQFASIEFCHLPVGPGQCPRAPDTPQIAPNCTDNFICDGSHGDYVTIPPGVANTSPVCIRLTYTLLDQIRGVAWGGPIQPSAPAIWPANASAQNLCGQAAPQ